MNKVLRRERTNARETMRAFKLCFCFTSCSQTSASVASERARRNDESGCS